MYENVLNKYQNKKNNSVIQYCNLSRVKQYGEFKSKQQCIICKSVKIVQHCKRNKIVLT